MKKITTLDRIRYRFDQIMSRGPAALIGWLFLLSAATVGVVTTFVVLTGIAPEIDGKRPGFGGVAWMSLMRVLDAGTMGGDSGSPSYLAAMFSVTMVGVFFVGALIGILSNGLDQKLAELRKGRSFVVETDHDLILGWSAQVFPILSELVTANANRGDTCIVILADRDKVEMEDEIKAKLGDTGRTRIVCRSGSPIDLTDLAIVNPGAARSIIIVAPEEEEPDSFVIKAMLALTNHPERGPKRHHIVAEIRDEQNLEAARIVGGDEAELVLVSDVISRITVQTSRQSGLSVVYTELLDFAGDEIYTQQEPRLVGKTFGEALHLYEDSSLIGLLTQGGRALLNPPMDTRIQDGDQVIAISEDDDTVRLSGAPPPPVDATAIRHVEPSPASAERILILGWNRRATKIINELDAYVAPGSTVDVVAEGDDVEEKLALHCSKLSNLQVTQRLACITDRRVLDGLGVAGYQHVITLGYSDRLEPQQADARTLITLLHLRQIAGRDHAFSLVSEMLDERNRQLAEVTRADDFIVSGKLVSLMLAQIAQNKRLGVIFEDLFNAAGSEVYIRPAESYVELRRPINFHTVVESARLRAEVAIGYRTCQLASDPRQQYGVRINPDKSKVMSFEAGDKVIVFAEK